MGSQGLVRAAVSVIGLRRVLRYPRFLVAITSAVQWLVALAVAIALLSSPAEAASKSGSYITGTRVNDGSSVQLWVPLDLLSGEYPSSVTITRVGVRGDLNLSIEYVDFRVSGSWIRYNPTIYGCVFTYYSYSPPNPQPVLTQVDEVDGFFVQVMLSTAVGTDYNCGAGNYADIEVSYTVEYSLTPNYAIGGSLSGLGTGKTVVLQNNGETLSLSSNGAFTFPTRVASGDSYAVTVAQQPVGESCSVSNGSGVATSSVTDIAVTCEDPYALAIGESKAVPPMPKGDVVTYKVDARQATSSSMIEIGTRGGSGDIDLFVGDGFEPDPYQNFTCKSETTGNTESCELQPGNFYYATLYAFNDARNVEIYAEALGAPDAPTITRADAADEAAKLYFNEPADNGAPIELFNASCSLAATASDQFASYSDGSRGLKAGHWRIESVAAANAPRWIDTSQDELLLRAPKWTQGEALPNRISLQGFDDVHELSVTFSEVTDTGDMFLVGTVLQGGEFSLLLTPGGQVVGRVKLDDDALLLDPSSVGGLSTLRSAARSGLTVAPMGRDDLEPPELSPEEVAAGDFVTSNDGHTQIDLLVLYPSGYSGALSNAQYMVSYANYIFNRSGTNTQFVVQSYSQYSPFAFDPLDDIRLSPTVADLRDRYRADLVAFVAPLNSVYGKTANYCGIAWVIGGNSNSYTTSAVQAFGFSVSFYGSSGGSYCTEETFAHELGHNMGAAHDRANSNVPPHRYNGYGDGTQGVFGTVMSYLSPEQAYFSSPNLFCAGGNKCGRYSYTNVVSAIQYVRATTAAAYPGDGPADGGGVPGEEYTVTPSAGYGGTVTPSSPQRGFKGNQKTFNFQPSDGYLLDTVTGSCSGVREGNQYVVTIGDKNCAFTGNFDVDGKSYGVRVSASTGGSVSPVGNFRVRPFDMLSVSITPDDGFSVANIGGSCPGSYSAWSRTFSTEEITEDCTISVQFAKTGNSVARSRSPITVGELTAGVEYECSVSASNIYGSGPASDPVLVTPFKTTAPGRPVIRSIDEDDGELWISFTPGGTGNLPVSYVATCGDVTSLPSSGSPITVSGLTNGLEVQCSITATNSKGSKTSVVVSATPDEQIRGIPVWLLHIASQPQ